MPAEHEQDVRNAGTKGTACRSTRCKSPWQILTNEQYFLRVADPSSRLRQEWCMRHVLQVAWRSGISVKVMRTPAGSAAVDKTSGWGRIFALENRSAKSRFHHPYGSFLRGVLRDRTTAHETASPKNSNRHRNIHPIPSTQIPCITFQPPAVAQCDRPHRLHHEAM